VKNVGPYALVTPAKNEADNVQRIFEVVYSQSVPPKLWVIVDDSSSDDTALRVRHQIELWRTASAATEILLVSHATSDSAYGLGKKYASVVKYGLSIVHKMNAELGYSLEYIGVLDCDVFPEPDYYKKLLARFDLDPNLGICSGGTLHEVMDDGTIEIATCSRSHAPGGLRLWRTACLSDTGYEPTISQDAVSEARAIMMGWRVRSFPDTSVETRKRGAKFGYSYYGRSAYVRCVPYWYVLLGAIKMLLTKRPKDASDYLKGYRSARSDRDPRIEDPLARRYFRWVFVYRLLGK
jgi:glycosyltransferase involved in cell wall biosynthesis